jgi:hypothetical protein
MKLPSAAERCIFINKFVPFVSHTKAVKSQPTPVKISPNSNKKIQDSHILNQRKINKPTKP